MVIKKDKPIEKGMETELRKLIKSGRLRGKKIYAMGSLYNIHRVNAVLKEYGLNIFGVLDNSPKMQGKKRLDDVDYTIFSPDILLKGQAREAYVLVFSMRFWGEMRDQLLAMGLQINRDFSILEALLIKKKMQYIQKGYRLYKRIMKKCGGQTYILLATGPIGDNYLFGLFYRQYLMKNHLSDCVWAGTGVAAKIARLYSVDKFIELSRDEIVAMEFLYSFLGDGILRMKVLQIWEFQFHFNRCRIRFDERFTFMDTYRHYVYNLPEDTQPQVPQFTCDEMVMEKRFSEIGLIPGKTVVLSPFAYSISHQPKNEFWIALTEKLKEKGYCVCLNANKNSEENFIPDTPILEFAIHESIKYVEYAGYFVGMRSGLCDVISSGSCRKIILYPERVSKIIDYDRHRYDVDFGGLNIMGLSEDAVEIEFIHDADVTYWLQMSESIFKLIDK